MPVGEDEDDDGDEDDDDAEIASASLNPHSWDHGVNGGMTLKMNKSPEMFPLVFPSLTAFFNLQKHLLRLLPHQPVVVFHRRIASTVISVVDYLLNSLLSMFATGGIQSLWLNMWKSSSEKQMDLSTMPGL